MPIAYVISQQQLFCLRFQFIQISYSLFHIGFGIISSLSMILIQPKRVTVFTVALLFFAPFNVKKQKKMTFELAERTLFVVITR